jgi:hypothetical protein
MFVALPRRQRPSLRWACPLLFGLLWLAFFWYSTRPAADRQALLQAWGALDGGPGTRLDLQAALRLVTALFPNARLGVVLPLGLFLEFVRAPASLLIGIWALLQVVFAYIGPAFGMVAWAAHVAGFLFGIVFALLVRRAVARRLRRQKGF